MFIILSVYLRTASTLPNIYSLSLNMGYINNSTIKETIMLVILDEDIDRLRKEHNLISEGFILAQFGQQAFWPAKIFPYATDFAHIVIRDILTFKDDAQTIRLAQALDDKLVIQRVAPLLELNQPNSGIPDSKLVDISHKDFEYDIACPYDEVDLSLSEYYGFCYEYKYHMAMQIAFPELMTEHCGYLMTHPREWPKYRELLYEAVNKFANPQQYEEPKRPGRPAAPIDEKAVKEKELKTNSYNLWIAQCQARKSAISQAWEAFETRQLKVREERTQATSYIATLKAEINKLKAENASAVDIEKANIAWRSTRLTLEEHKVQWAKELHELKATYKKLKNTPAPQRIVE